MNLYSVSYQGNVWLRKTDAGTYTHTIIKDERHMFYTRKQAIDAIEEYVDSSMGQVLKNAYGDQIKSWYQVHTERYTCSVGKHIQI